jgi:beta-lactam-binding protein with PASTA domain
VPNVVGQKLATAKARLKRAHCRVGEVTRAHSSLARKGRVLSQKPKASRRKRPNGFKVRLVVGRGP